MSKHRVAVLKVVAGRMSVTAAAVASGMSRQHLHRLLHRYREGGLEALEPRSRRPRSNPGRTPDAVQKNGAPGHPQTQGKIERFHQTLKRWLGAGAGADQRCRAAGAARRLPPRVERAAWLPAPAPGGHYRLRYDVADGKGAITLRRAGRLHHLNTGAAHARQRVLAIVDEREVTVVALATGEILSTHLIEPDRRYWRNTRRDPGRWPGPRATG